MAKIEAPDVRRLAFALTERVPIRATVNEQRRTPGLLYDMHYELELGIMLEGCMERRFERTEYAAGPGQVWMCGIWEPHGYRVVSEISRVLVIVIRPELLVQMSYAEAPGRSWLAPFTAPPKQRPRATPDQQGALLELAHRFIRTLAAEEEERALRQRLLVVEILLTLTRGWRAPAVMNSPASHYARISKAVELVFAERGLISAVEAARSCSLSRNHFDRLFHGLMRLSFARFALRYRLGNAAGQLIRSDDALKKVADDWGFTDASHLVHCFQKHYGCTPLEYRLRKQTERAEPGGLGQVQGGGAWNARVERDSK